MTQFFTDTQAHTVNKIRHYQEEISNTILYHTPCKLFCSQVGMLKVFTSRLNALIEEMQKELEEYDK